jgi:hypothetical protein
LFGGGVWVMMLVGGGVLGKEQKEKNKSRMKSRFRGEINNNGQQNHLRGNI